MKVYDREVEIAELQRRDHLADTTAQFTVLMGRRRTGKTSLAALLRELMIFSQTNKVTLIIDDPLRQCVD